MISMLAMAAMVSCTNEIEGPDQPKVNGNEQVEIKATAGVLGVETKAPIINGTKFTPAIVGWEGTATPTTEAPAWNTTTSSDIEAGSNVSMPFKDKKYYNPDGTTHTYICAFFPTGTITSNIVSFTNTNADQDIILTNIVDAGAKPAGVAAATMMTFSHKLTQLQFKVGGDASLATGTKIKSISLVKVTVPTSFNIVTGDLNGTESATFTVPNLTESVIPTMSEDGTGASNAGDPIMIKPIGGTTFSINVVTDQGTFNNVTVTLAQADTDGGISYNVTLTFKQKEITAQGTVTAWTEKTGTGTVE